MPKKNKKDLVDVPQEVVDTVDIRLMETIDEVLKNALLPGPNVTPAQIEAARPSIPTAAPAH
jgi:ATP-dependent Lon protease